MSSASSQASVMSFYMEADTWTHLGPGESKFLADVVDFGRQRTDPLQETLSVYDDPDTRTERNKSTDTSWHLSFIASVFSRFTLWILHTPTCHKHSWFRRWPSCPLCLWSARRSWCWWTGGCFSCWLESHRHRQRGSPPGTSHSTQSHTHESSNITLTHCTIVVPKLFYKHKWT